MLDYLSVTETAQKFNVSNRRVQILCEQGRIAGAQMISGVWLIPANTDKPKDGRKKSFDQNQTTLFDMDVNSQLLTFNTVCDLLSISQATGRNWVKLRKLIPIKKEGKNLYFAKNDIGAILDAISNGESKALNRRRNKKKMNDLTLYESYISETQNIDLVNGIIAEIGSDMSPQLLRAILSNIALQFICLKKNIPSKGNVLAQYLNGNLSIEEYRMLMDDLIGDKEQVEKVALASPILSKEAKYVRGEDTLGFVYISLVNIGERKATGAYYTPLPVVNTLISHLSNVCNISRKTVFDPCCGSGNFLLSIGEKTNTPELLFGQDIDHTAVQLARISFALRYDMTDMAFLCSHFTCADTLISPPRTTYDIVIGNPPWGGDLLKEHLATLSTRYRTAVKKGAETYNLFMECALSLLSENGIVAFVLPEAILNVAAHATIRSILIDQCAFKFVRYLGNVFSGVQCPSIIFGVQKTKNKAMGVDEVFFGDDSYSIGSNRQITVERFSFHVKDKLQDALDAIQNLSEQHTLSNNARFALGIVTGDNTAYTSTECRSGYEPVLKGSEIRKYRIGTNGNYICFTPQKFQQVAPTELYRAPEKLFYRFICETLVFAYDDQQTLSLNSCNILIPQIPNIDIKYILAILNSRAANFYFINKFNSVKVLRSHIEQIPIPTATEKEQKHVISLVDRLINGNVDTMKVYNELDEYIMLLYGLKCSVQKTLISSLEGRNLFLT